MNLLLDTHALLWWLADDPQLATTARDAIAQGENDVHVSAASVWEIAIKRTLGKLDAPDDLLAEIDRQRFVHLPLTSRDTWTAGHLPVHHSDPFDRALIAQAVARDLRIVTRDPRFAAYGIDVLST